VYSSPDALVTDVKNFHKLHIQAGGSATIAAPRVQQQQQLTLPNSGQGSRQPAGGSKRTFSTYNDHSMQD
jgi:hypothetical protein